jgi:hypothetical protein
MLECYESGMGSHPRVVLFMFYIPHLLNGKLERKVANNKFVLAVYNIIK